MTKVLIISSKIDLPVDNANKATVLDLVSNIENVFFTILISNNSDKTFLQKNKNVFLDPVYDPSAHHMSFVQKVRLFFRLCQRDSDIDIYHCMMEPSMLTILLLKFFITLKRKKSVITLLNKIENPYIINQLRFFDKIVVSSDHMKNILERKGITNIERIYPSVDLKKLTEKKRNKESFWRTKLKLGHDPVVLFAGNYHPWQGIYDIEMAIPKIMEKIPEAKFIFACRTYFKHQYVEGQKLARRLKSTPFGDSFFFLETVERIKDLLVEADVVLFPMHKVQKKSDIPIVLLEALAVETPIIITDIPPLNEIMKGKIGHLIPVGDPQSLAEATVHLLVNPLQRQELGRCGREVVKEYFNSENMARQYFEIYSGMS